MECWAKDCPNRNKEEVSGDKDGKEKIILFSEEIENCYIETFLGKIFNEAILDSGDAETVWECMALVLLRLTQ